MSRFESAIAFVAVLSVFMSACVVAQNPTTCKESTAKPINTTEIGNVNWFEMAINPAHNATVACVQDIFKFSDNNVNVTNKYADSSNLMMQSKEDILTGTLDNTTNLIYLNQTGMTYKILDSNTTAYLLVCGYNASAGQSDPDVSFGMLLTREFSVSASQVADYWKMGSNFTNFQTNATSNYTLINQNEKCYYSGAASTLPVLTAILTALYALFQLN